MTAPHTPNAVLVLATAVAELEFKNITIPLIIYSSKLAATEESQGKVRDKPGLRLNDVELNEVEDETSYIYSRCLTLNPAVRLLNDGGPLTIRELD